jgi:hypothetical protein
LRTRRAGALGPLTFEAIEILVEGKRVAGGFLRQRNIVVVSELLDTWPV